MVDIKACEMAGARPIIGQSAIQANGRFFQAIAAKAQARLAELTELGNLGQVIDRAPTAPEPYKKLDGPPIASTLS